MIRRTRIFVLLAALMILQSLARVLPQGLFRLLPPPLNYFDLALGIAGLVAVPALLMLFRWGYWGAIVASAMTIIFDLWAIFQVSWTALLGVLVPALLLLYLVPKHSQLIAGR